MDSRDEFIKAVAADKTRETGAAVFLVELGDGLDQATLEQAVEVLENLVGKHRLTFFRVC